MSKNYDGWENALTVLQEARPPFIPEGVHAMTVVVDYPPAARAPLHTATQARLSVTCSKASCSSS